MDITVTDFHHLLCRFDLFEKSVYNGFRRYGLSPFGFVAVSVSRRFDCRRFGLSPF